MELKKWTRLFYQPGLPLGKDGRRVTSSKKHIELSRRAATEGMVLLENNGLLPFSKGTKLAVFGKAQIDYVKGGGGSGDVAVAYVRDLYEGLTIKENEGKISLFHPLSDYYRDYVNSVRKPGSEAGKVPETTLPANLLSSARDYTDTALITLCRFSSEAYDRKGEPGDGDFYLSPEEEAMVTAVYRTFPHVAVCLNVGGMVDTSWFCNGANGIDAVLLAWQAGMEGGLATADILCGDANPSAHLTDTFARSFSDYPSSEHFNDSDKYVYYNDDIYVGYRYFETLPGMQDKVNYCFGYGLSYTTFALSEISAAARGTNIVVRATVTNTGNRAGKQVVQVYCAAPQGKLGKPARVLMAFAKTKELRPGEKQSLRISFPISSMASYDDVGKVCEAAYILEGGDYDFYVGTSVRDTQKTEYSYHVKGAYKLIEQLTHKCRCPESFDRLLSNGQTEHLEGTPLVSHRPSLTPIAVEKPEKEIKLIDVYEGRADLDTFLVQFTDEELLLLLHDRPNRGVANTFGLGGDIEKYGVPSAMSADGPAGLRVVDACGVKATAWPCATMMACSFNTDLVEEVGRAGAMEVLENNIEIWLTPALNIHRSPLCGRNFEYYSEDPLVSGKMAAAVVRGIQSTQISACVKHFACNNKETNRKWSDSRLSERALREIYLRGFEIAVKESDPWCLMTAYNLINGVPAGANYELITDILRGEWGYRGCVTTDWWTTVDAVDNYVAGNDVKMQCYSHENTMKALAEGRLTRAELEACAKRELALIMKLA